MPRGGPLSPGPRPAGHLTRPILPLVSSRPAPDLTGPPLEGKAPAGQRSEERTRRMKVTSERTKEARTLPRMDKRSRLIRSPLFLLLRGASLSGASLSHRSPQSPILGKVIEWMISLFRRWAGAPGEKRPRPISSHAPPARAAHSFGVRKPKLGHFSPNAPARGANNHRLENASAYPSSLSHGIDFLRQSGRALFAGTMPRQHKYGAAPSDRRRARKSLALQSKPEELVRYGGKKVRRSR